MSCNDFLRLTGRAIIIAAVATVMMACTRAMDAAPTITNLGTISNQWFAGSSAYGVSDDGSVVVGISSVDSGSAHAFRWTNDAGMQDLGTLLPDDYGHSEAYGVSSDGSVVVGYTNTTWSLDERAFYWTASGGMIDLGTLPNGDRSYAYGISGDGSVVVGQSNEVGGLPHAFRWTAAEGMQDLGTLPNGAWAAASSVSGDGAVVVGNALNVASGGGVENLRAFRWTASGGMQDLGTLPGGRFSQRPSANTDGSVVVGSANFAGPDPDAQHVFRWTSQGGMIDLGCPPGGYSCNAYDVSGDGSTIVGRSITAGRAFLWTAQLGMVDLDNYLPTLGLDLAGWRLTEATAISADGSVIVGFGYYNGDGRAWRVTGVPPALPGDFNHDGTVNSADYVVWRKGLGTIYAQSDYNVWRAHFGQTAGSGAGGSDSLTAGIPEPATAFLLLIVSVVAIRRPRRSATTELSERRLPRRSRIERGFYFAASSLLVLLGSASARGTTIEFVYRGTFEYIYADLNATFAISPGAPWTARLLFDGAAQNQYPPYLYDQSLAVYQGISVDLTIGDSSIQFHPVWIGVADNYGESVRSGHFYDSFDVTAGSSTEVYLGLNDPTLAAIHSTALPTTINLADWSNRDIVFSPSGVYATGTVDQITSRVIPEPELLKYRFAQGQFEFLNGDKWDVTAGEISLQLFDVLVTEEGFQRAVFGVTDFSLTAVDAFGASHTITAVPDGMNLQGFQDPSVPEFVHDIGLVNVYPDGILDMFVYDLSIDGEPVDPLDTIGGPSFTSTWLGTFPLPTNFSVSMMADLRSRNLFGQVTLSGQIVPEPASAVLLAIAALGFVLTLDRCKSKSARASTRLVVASIALLVSASPTHAAMFNASNVAELISAIDAANQNAEPDKIALAAGNTFALTQINSSMHGATGLPSITASDNLTILGNGGVIERSTAAGTPLFRLFDVAAQASLVLENLTLQGGVTDLIYPNGGAIYNAGTMTLTNVTIQNNVAKGRVGTGCSVPCGGTGGTGWPGWGGGIYSAGSLRLEDSALQNNRSEGGHGGFGVRGGGRGGDGRGGGLYALAGTATLYRSTVSGNVAQGGVGGNGGTGPSGSGYGGGIYIANAQVGLDEFTLAHVTGNTASTNFPNISGPYDLIPNSNPLPGDFNEDGAVDAADYVVWRKNPGGIYTRNHYTVWRANVGATLGSGSGGTSTFVDTDSAVPETSSVLLLVFATALLCANCRRTTAPSSTPPNNIYHSARIKNPARLGSANR